MYRPHTVSRDEMTAMTVTGMQMELHVLSCMNAMETPTAMASMLVASASVRMTL